MKLRDSLFLEQPLELNGATYDCALQIDVELTRWTENHGPGLQEPMAEPFVDVTDLSAMLEGAEVEDKHVLRQLKIEAQAWCEQNVQMLVQKAGL